ncbi:MAG: 50S ribosomal protein L25 [Patescibacteria group bacterium]
MDSMTLEVALRKPQAKGRHVRLGGEIPAVYYGRGQKPMSLQLSYQKFRKVFEKAGENTIIELELDGKKHPVLVHEVQYDPVLDTVIHIDFIHVDMQKEVTTSVKVVLVGVSPAVKNIGGVLDLLKHEIEIKCLPKDLIHAIEVDITPIVDFKTSIRVKDLKVPSSVKILDDAEDTVVTASPPRAEEETKPAEVAPAEGAAAPGAEGATPAPGAPAAAAPAAGKEAKK